VRGGFTDDVLVMSWRQLWSSFCCSSFSSGGGLPGILGQKSTFSLWAA